MDAETIKTIKSVLIPELDPVFLILFGSQATKSAHPASDVDIAFYSQNKKPSPYETFLLAQELAATLNTDVDLINIREATTVFQAQIYTNGHVIYCRDNHIHAQAQMTALSMYVKLNEERQPILKKIQERGSVYGQ